MRAGPLQAFLCAATLSACGSDETVIERESIEATTAELPGAELAPETRAERVEAPLLPPDAIGEAGGGPADGAEPTYRTDEEK